MFLCRFGIYILHVKQQKNPSKEKSWYGPDISTVFLYIHVYYNKTLNQFNMAASIGRFKNRIKL